MQKVSRRKFVIGASAGAAVIAVGAGGTAIAVTQSNAAHQKAVQFASTLDTHLAAYVRDANKGEVVLLANNQQVVIQDVDLATRLLNAAQK